MKKIKLLPFFLLLLFILLVTGGFFAWRQSLPAENGDSVNGAVFGLAAEAPVGIPEDIPIFQPSLIISKNETKQGLQLTLEINYPKNTVANFYKDQLKQFGWQEITTGQYKKYGGKSLEISFTGGETEKTIVIISYNQ